MALGIRLLPIYTPTPLNPPPVSPLSGGKLLGPAQPNFFVCVPVSGAGVGEGGGVRVGGE